MTTAERAMLVVGFSFALAASTGVACLTLGFGRWAVLVGAGMAFALGLTFGPKMLRLK